MKRAIQYIIMLVMAITFVITGCKKDDYGNKNQVYYDRYSGSEEQTPFLGTCDVVAEPLEILTDRGKIPSATFSSDDFPWTISGKIIEGKMEITFPNGNYNLTFDYEDTFTEGARIACIFVRRIDVKNYVLALHKWNKNVFGRIYIYYADKDFSKFNNGTVKLKKGWNFVEFINDKDNDIYDKVGKISQNINDFIKDGYRWTFEMWI